MTEPSEPTAAPVVLDLPLLETLRALQLANGLGHSDFQRYRLYCDRRLRRIRSGLKLTHGRGRQFVPQTVTAEAVTEERHLMIPLLNAERAWSFAMELKDDIMLETESGNLNERTKFRVARRLRKASKWAAQVQELCHAVGTARTRAEADAYKGWVDGWLALEKEQFRESLEAFTTASRIYSQLGTVGSAEQQDLYHSRVEEIAASVRLCQYRLGDASDSLEDLLHGTGAHTELLQTALDDVRKSTLKAVADNLSSVQWLGQEVPVTSERVRVALAGADGSVADLAGCADDKERDRLYGQLFNACDEALRGCAEEAAVLAKMKAGARVDSQRAQLAKLEGYVLSLKLHHLIAKTEALVKATEADPKGCNPNDILHMYDGLRRFVGELRQIPEVEDDEAQSMRLDALDARYRAARCHALVLSLSAQDRFAEATALSARVAELLEFAQHKVEDLDDDDEASRQALQRLATEAAVSRTTLKARAFLSSAAAPPSAASGATLLERKDTFDAGTPENRRLADFPPDLRAVPVKPLFFDNAFNCLQPPKFDGLKVRKGAASASASAGGSGAGAAAPAAAGGGLFGWLRGS